MKHPTTPTTFLRIVALLLLMVLLFSCGADETKGELTEALQLSTPKVYVPEAGEFDSDATNDYAKTKKVLLDLGLPQAFVDRLSRERLSDYAEAYQIVLFSTTAWSEDGPQLYATLCFDFEGKFRYSLDAVWKELPVERYRDVFSFSAFDTMLDATATEDCGWLAYGNVLKNLVSGQDFSAVHGAVHGKGEGYVYDLGALTEGLNPTEGEPLYLHLEGQLFFRRMMVTNTNLCVNYDHSLSYDDGETELGSCNGQFYGFLFDPDTGLSIQRSTLLTKEPFCYTPPQQER